MTRPYVDTELINNLFAPMLQVAEALRAAPDIDGAPEAFHSVYHSAWLKTTRMYREFDLANMPRGHAYWAVSWIFILKKSAQEQCISHDDLARYLYVRADRIAQVSKWGWLAAKQGGNVPEDSFAVEPREIWQEFPQGSNEALSNNTSEVPNAGYLGGTELAESLGIPPSSQGAFLQQLGRKRRYLTDDDWEEVSNPRPNTPRYLYKTDSAAIKAIASKYRQ